MTRKSTDKEVSVSPTSGVTPSRRTSSRSRSKRTAAPAEPPASSIQTPVPEIPEVQAKAIVREVVTPVNEPAYQEIAALAYEYWQRRGQMDGCAEEDWLRAEMELRLRGRAANA